MQGQKKTRPASFITGHNLDVMKTRLAPVNQKRNLAKALKPYKRWDEWTNSPACFLSKLNVQIIEIYRKTGSYARCNQKLNITIVAAANRLLDAIFRLQAFLALYQKWEQGPPNLFEVVNAIGVNTLEDLKELTYEDLKQWYENAYHHNNQTTNVLNKSP